MKYPFDPHRYDTLKHLKDDTLRVADLLRPANRKEVEAWADIVQRKLLTRFSPEFPITVSICGGGSSGKSTLFNSLVKEHLSPVGGRAGINRRTLVCAHPELFHNKVFVSALFEPFGSLPRPLETQQDLTVAGCPLFVPNDAIPRNLVLMDTPDFDTGSKGVYVNREASQQALEASDILIYIFTNSNYNNRDNTDFIARILTDIGMRKCFMVYRVYPNFDETEVREHAMTVAHNLYGDAADQYVLGIYRTDEDNAVAAGKRFMSLRSADKNAPDFIDALKTIDSGKLRSDLFGSIFDDAVAKSREFLEQSKDSHNALRSYLEALLAAQSHCVQQALQRFPLDLVLKSFARIWMSKDPGHVRAMRKAGSIIDLPFKFLFNTARRVMGKTPSEKTDVRENSFKDKIREDLLQATNSLRRQTVDSEITHEKGGITFSIPAHPAVSGPQNILREKDWKSVVASIFSQPDVIFELSEGIEKELNRLADSFRHKMGFWSKIRQTFFAVLNVVPATAAVTYVLSTGDPVGAAGIKVKLTGLFGLHDLYALIAIPATTGLKKADLKQLDAMLGPIMQTWLTHKLAVIQDIFEQEITGEVIRTAKDTIADTAELLGRIEINLELCSNAITP